VQAATAAPPQAAPRTPAAAARRRFLPGERICPGLLACEPLGGDDRIERWLAWSQELWARVVVELPRDEHADDLRIVRRLAHEARTLRRLSHPAIPRLLDDRHDQPVPHLVLEHTQGRTLDRVLAGGSVAPADVARLGVRLAACLRYVHGRGLADVGLELRAVAVRCGEPVLLHAGSARGLRQADPRRDMVALGAVMRELLAGANRVPPALDAAVDAMRGRRPMTDLDAIQLLMAALPPDETPAWPPFAEPLAQAV
jgi:serine/threonine-protein kinase